MTVQFYIVDDHKPRALAFQAAIAERGCSGLWFRPEIPEYQRADFPCEEGEQRVAEPADLISLVTHHADSGPPAIWIWDVDLPFQGGKLSDSDYKVGATLQAALFKLLEKGHVIALISNSEVTPLIRQEWIEIRPAFAGRVKEWLRSWDTLGKTQGNRERWIRDVLDQSISSLGNGIIELWSKPDWERHFVDKGPGLPHDFAKCTWESFLPVLSECLGRSYLPQQLSDALRPNFCGYFEALKTLIGAYAKCHVGTNYRPNMGVIPILILRAAIQSGKWTDTELTTLAGFFKFDAECRYRPLCSEWQSMNQIRVWLHRLADELLPRLVENKLHSARANIRNCEIKTNERFVRIVFEDEWAGFAKRVHNLLDEKGNTSRALRDAIVSLGDCGEDVGFDCRCIVSAWIRDGKTFVEFRTL